MSLKYYKNYKNRLHLIEEDDDIVISDKKPIKSFNKANRLIVELETRNSHLAGSQTLYNSLNRYKN